MIKDFNRKHRLRLLNLLQKWWSEGKLPTKLTTASVVSLYKKGNPNTLSNDRPISLLNTLYTIIAAIAKNRIGKGAENIFQNTQYGFRQEKVHLKPYALPEGYKNTVRGAGENP